MPTGTCPECDADVHVDLDTDKGEIVSCEECGTDLEVVGLDHVELDIVEEESYEAIDDLARLRTAYWPGDSAVRLHALAASSPKLSNSCPRPSARP